MTLYRIVLPYACFGIEADSAGVVRRNREIGTTLIYRTLKAMKRHVEACGGTIEEVAV